MRIGLFAREVGLSVKTVRFYEAEGLLRKPERSPAGYRLYQESAITEAVFVRRCRYAALSVAKTRRLAAIRRAGVQSAYDAELVSAAYDEVRAVLGDIATVQGVLRGALAIGQVRTGVSLRHGGRDGPGGISEATDDGPTMRRSARSKGSH